MDKKLFGMPFAIATILVIDAIVIGLYASGALQTNKGLIGAKIIGTTALVGASLIA